jgi:hypothetical protein
MLVSGWCLVWLPLFLASYFDSSEITGITTENVQSIQYALARTMVLGAFVLVGALPLFLWGRFEGFPNFLLAAVCSWGLSWALAVQLKLDVSEEPGWRWWLLGGLLAVKISAALVAFVRGLTYNHITWKFPVLLLAGWWTAAALMVLVLPTWKSGGLWGSLYLVLLLPLARLAWCPLALAANRHR